MDQIIHADEDGVSEDIIVAEGEITVEDGEGDSENIEMAEAEITDEVEEGDNEVNEVPEVTQITDEDEEGDSQALEVTQITDDDEEGDSEALEVTQITDEEEDGDHEVVEKIETDEEDGDSEVEVIEMEEAETSDGEDVYEIVEDIGETTDEDYGYDLDIREVNQRERTDIRMEDNDEPSLPVSRHLRSYGKLNEEVDWEFSPKKEHGKRKTTMVGPDHQAVIPEGLSKYDDALFYENKDNLLWDPNSLEEEEVKNYLNSVMEIHNTGAGLQGNNSGISGSVQQWEATLATPRDIQEIRDNEQALHVLQQSGKNVQEALSHQKVNIPSRESTLWSEEECQNFESGLRHYGKDFYTIQQKSVRTRSVGELVEFYYFWKKTERHDIFASLARLEKKRFNAHPATSNFMDQYLDFLTEQNSPVFVSKPNSHSLLAGDPKRSGQMPPQFRNADSDSSYEVESELNNAAETL